MYIVIKAEQDSPPESLFFVKARSSDEAKEMVGVDTASSLWLVVAVDALKELDNSKKGFFEKLI